MKTMQGASFRALANRSLTYDAEWVSKQYKRKHDRVSVRESEVKGLICESESTEMKRATVRGTNNTTEAKLP
jgi:hypothetical protein